MRPGTGHFLSRTPLNEPTPPRSPREAAKVEAFVQLEQSLVPGATQLLRLTEIDLIERGAWRLPELDDEPAENIRHREEMDVIRDERTLSRIGRWGLNPELMAAKVIQEYVLASSDADTYWQRNAYSNPSFAIGSPPAP